MSYNGVVWTNVAGASNAAAGQTIQSAVWNAIFIDYSNAFNLLNAQYASVNTNRNIAWMNGGLEVWQRGAGNSANISVAASTTAYWADRWYVTNGVNQSMAFTASTGLSTQSFRSGKIQRTAGQTGTTTIIIGYPMDTDEIMRVRNLKCVLGALIKPGTNFSGTLTVQLVYTTAAGDPVPGKLNGGGTTTAVSTSVSLSAGQTTLLSLPTTAVIPATAKQVEIQFIWVPSGTAGVDDSFTIDDVTLEALTTSYTSWTPMNYDRLPFQTMLDGCKRHYQKTFPYNTAPATATNSFGGNSWTNNDPGVAVALTGGIGNGSFSGLPITWNYPVETRVAASQIYQIYNPVSANNTVRNITGSTDIAEVFPGTTSNVGTKSLGIFISQVTATSTIAQQLYFHAVIDASI